MAREVRIIERYGNNSAGEVMSFTCLSSEAIPKGTILKFADPRTASASTGTGDIFAGFADMEKDDSDTSTTIGAITDCVAECYASGSITAGDQVITAAPGNYVMSSNSITSNPMGKLVGIAQETRSAGEVVAIKVKK